MRKKQNAATYYKNPALQESIIKYYKKQKLDFKVKHSNYNTQIIGTETTLKFIQTEHPIRVFIAYNKIVKDLKESSKTTEVLASEWSTANFNSRNGLKPGFHPTILNLDLSSAYPYCLYLNKLITLDTFNYLMQMPKNERLPAIGMIAKKSVWITYTGGKAEDWELKQGDYTQIFFYVIQQITDLMEWAAEIAGDSFLFYWVDGIFIKPTISKKKLKEITDIFSEQGYYFKYENVKNCSIVRDGDKLLINMIKNGEHKPYQMYDKNLARNFTKVLQQLEDAEQNTLHLSGITA
jgi:hypothetical protein